MSTQKDIVSDDVQEMHLKDKRYKDVRVLESKITAPTLKGVVFNGLLIENSYVGSLSATSILGRNVIIGPKSSISYGFMDKITLKQGHAVLNSQVRNTLITNSGFANGTYRAATFDRVAFHNVLFIGCRFVKAVFKDCSFSSCIFYKCRFTHNDDGSPFTHCNFWPNDPVTHVFPDGGEWWPLVAAQFVDTNFIIGCGGKIKISKSDGLINISQDKEEGRGKIDTNFPSFSEPETVGGNKAIQHAISRWWDTESSGYSMPPEGSNFTSKKPTVTIERSNRAYRFITSGV